MPFAPGTADLRLSLHGAANASIAVSVEDTYQPTWPRASPAGDTAAALTANMSGDFSVLFRAVPSAGLDLAGDPPSAAWVEGSGAVSLAADAARGPHFYAATAGGLMPGTNYTLLLAVRGGLSLSSGVTALSGLLVPDTAPPSFTAARLVGQASNASEGGFALTLDLGLSEAGALSYAIYGDPACITGERRRCVCVCVSV